MLKTHKYAFSSQQAPQDKRLNVSYACSDTRTECVRTDGTCLFPAAPQGGAHQPKLEMRGSPWCTLGITLMKRTRLTDRSTPLRDCGCTWRHLRSDTHTHRHGFTTNASAWAHAHKGRRIHDYWQLLLLSPASYRGAAFSKGVSMKWKRWIQVFTLLTRFKVMGGLNLCRDKFVISTNTNWIEIKMEVSDKV